MIRKWFFLRQKWILATFFLSIFAFFFFEQPWNWIGLIAGTGWLYLHRRLYITSTEGLKNDGELFLSPIDGEIVKIGTFTNPEDHQDYIEIRINTFYYHCWGLYLPYDSEMAYLKERAGNRFPRSELATLSQAEIEKMSLTDVVLKSPSGPSTHMRFLRCVNGNSPHIWMKSGDRGRGAACFGYYPFGGCLIVFVPAKSDVLVVVNEKIKAAESVLAVLRPHQEEISNVR